MDPEELKSKLKEAKARKGLKDLSRKSWIRKKAHVSNTFVYNGQSFYMVLLPALRFAF